MEAKQRLHDVERMKRMAFFAIAVSTMATLTAIVAIPCVYTYLQHVQSSLQLEIDFCRHRTDGLYFEYRRIDNAPRLKREVFRKASGSTGGGAGGHVRARGADTYGEATPQKKGKKPEQTYATAPPAPQPSGYDGPAQGVEQRPAVQEQHQAQCGCSCGIGQAGPPGQPGADGQPGEFWKSSFKISLPYQLKSKMATPTFVGV